jgi:lipopolysaccharide transport system permease protein
MNKNNKNIFAIRLNLVRELALKDIKIRYSKPVLGFFWAFLSPIFMVIILYIMFGLVFKIEQEGAPFVLYLMTGVFPWMFFQDSVLKSISSLVDNRNLLRESGFSHYLIPVSIVLSNAVIFIPSLFIVITGSFFVLGRLPIFILLLPVVFILHIFITMMLSVIVSIVYVGWRDLKYIIESALLLLFYMTPVFYQVSFIRDSFSDFLFKLYLCNPFTAIAGAYRMVLVGGFDIKAAGYAEIYDIVFRLFIFTVLITILAVYVYLKNRKTINDSLFY